MFIWHRELPVFLILQHTNFYAHHVSNSTTLSSTIPKLAKSFSIHIILSVIHCPDTFEINLLQNLFVMWPLPQEIVISMFLLNSAISPDPCIEPWIGVAQCYASQIVVYIYKIPTNWPVHLTDIIDLLLNFFPEKLFGL